MLRTQRQRSIQIEAQRIDMQYELLNVSIILHTITIRQQMLHDHRRRCPHLTMQDILLDMLHQQGLLSMRLINMIDVAKEHMELLGGHRCSCTQSHKSIRIERAKMAHSFALQALDTPRDHRFLLIGLGRQANA